LFRIICIVDVYTLHGNKLKEAECVGHAARIGDMIKAYKTLVCERESKRPLRD